MINERLLDKRPFVCYLGLAGFEKVTSKPQIRHIVQNIR